MIVEKFGDLSTDNLIIVDVQKSFSKFFTTKYLKELNSYCNSFKDVYQIWDNHVDGKNVDKDFLYEENPEIPIHNDLYTFNRQKELIEKRYNYNVKIDFYKSILDSRIFNEIKNKEDSKTLKKGDKFQTTKGTYIIFIGNKHRWTHIGIKLVGLFKSLESKHATIVGGSDSECLEDIFVSAESFGIRIKRNWRFIYSANHCPIK